MNIGKRMGYMGLSLLAFLAALVVMLVAQSIVLFPAMILSGIEAGKQGSIDETAVEQMIIDTTNEVAPIAVLVSHLALFLVFALWYRFGCRKPGWKRMDKKQLLAPKYVLAMVLVGAGMCLFTNFAMVLVYDSIPQAFKETYETMMETSQFGDNILATIAAVFIAPIGEELIFRGVAFYYARKAVSGMSHQTLGFWIANVVQAFLFGLLHMNIIQGTYAFLLGLVLGYMVHRYGTILPGIVGHFLFNAISTFLMDPISSLLPENEVVYSVIAVISVAVVGVGLFLTSKREKMAVLESY